MNNNKSSYAQILKASSIMGGAAGINLLLGMVRVKFAAVLIGATGVGLSASFGALQGLIGTVAGLGIQSSAVREISVAVGKNDDQAIGRAVLILRRLCWLTGLLGMLAITLLSPLLSELTFGHRGYALDIAALGVVILFGNLSGAQMALIQGMRRIGDMARANISGAVFGTVSAIVFYATMGLRGIVPSLIAVSVFQLALSWYFARKLLIPKTTLTWRQTFKEAGTMVRLGVAMMWTALLSSAVTYGVISVIANNFSIQSAGIYNAAMALSGLVVGFVLQAMSADYLPRLSSLQDNKLALTNLVNQQTQIALLLATPGLTGTLVFADSIVPIFYSSDFSNAVDLLRWMILGCLGKILSWPLGFVLVAMKKTKIYFFTQTLGHGVHFGLIILLLNVVGLEGSGIAFFATYAITFPLNFIILVKIIGFKWSKKTISIALMSCVFVLSAFLLELFRDSVNVIFIGLAITAIYSYYSLIKLSDLLGSEHNFSKVIGRITSRRR